MATQEATVKVNRGAVNALASAIAKGIAEVNASGSLLTQCVKIARAQYRGAAIPKQDVQAVLDELAESQKWSKASVAVRQSEYRSVLQQYPKLEEAMKAYTARAGKCTWHDGIALSRLLRKANPTQAAKQHASRGKAKSVDPGTLSRGDAKSLVAKFAKRVLKMTKIEREFRDALRELCSAHSIKV
jgi:hypothetical protein